MTVAGSCWLKTAIRSLRPSPTRHWPYFAADTFDQFFSHPATKSIAGFPRHHSCPDCSNWPESGKRAVEPEHLVETDIDVVPNGEVVRESGSEVEPRCIRQEGRIALVIGRIDVSRPCGGAM